MTSENGDGENSAKVLNGDDVKQMTDRQLLELLPCLMNKLETYEQDMIKMKKRLEESENQISLLKEKLEEKEVENSLLQSANERFELAIEDLQQRSRHTNIVIRGIKEERKENVWNITESIGRRIGIENPENDIQICHRVPTRSQDGPRPIVVRLLNSKTRDKWIKEYKLKKLWSQHIYINEHLTPYNQNLFYHTRKLAKEEKYKFAWTKDCQIYLKKNETAKLITIKNMRDLDQIRSFSQGSDLDETFCTVGTVNQ